MADELILADRIGKKFHRSMSGAIWHGLRKTLRFAPKDALDKDEFWALRDISFVVKRGECLGLIGPNGAGKTTLLKLIHREYPADSGRIVSLGRTQSLIRLGTGLQPLLSGRENILIVCQQIGLAAREAQAMLDGIVAFAGLEQAIDAPVKTYSDGMYARLGFAMATSVTADILLVDEVLAVGDIAFQIRALDRLNQLKRNGAAVVFVSHSEMNVRHVADHCLLLFDGRQIALGQPDALFERYYSAVGYLNRRLQPLGVATRMPPEVAGVVAIHSLRKENSGEAQVRTGDGLALVLDYVAESEVADAVLILHCWNAADVLAASVDSELSGTRFHLRTGAGHIKLHLPFVGLAPGHYRLAAGFAINGEWQAYRSKLLDLYITQPSRAACHGLAVLDATFENP
jgi:ABC-type polysaccharide/polyol phosphate transport system ATPase subunit